MTAILQLIAALPGLVQLGLELLSFIKSVSKDDPAKFVADLGAAFSLLNKAKTDEEKINAAKAIQSVLRGL